MVLITGASSGIGEACAWKFAQEKYPLFLVARRLEKLKLLADAIKAKFDVVIEIAELDVSKKKGVEAWAHKSSPLLSKVEILINNAGLARGFGPFQTGNVEDWEVMIDTNMKGLLYISRVVVPYFLEKKEGHIVHLGSVAGRWAYPNGNIYCATKSAVAMLTETMRIDLLGTGIRVTNISPGMVKTNFSLVRFEHEEKAKSLYKGMTPLTGEDIADTVFWATSRPRHINIQEIVIYPTDQASTHHTFRTTKL